MKRLPFNKALRILLATNGLVLLSAAMIGPIYALFVEDVGGNLLYASLTGGVFAFAAGLTTLFAGKFADKHKRDEILVAIGYSIMGLGFFLYIFANSIWFLFAIEIILGFSEAFYSPSFDALFSRHITRKKAGREWGAWESMNYFSIALGAAIGGIIVNKFGFNVVFIIMSTLCFASAIYIFRLRKRTL